MTVFLGISSWLFFSGPFFITAQAEMRGLFWSYAVDIPVLYTCSNDEALGRGEKNRYR